MPTDHVHNAVSSWLWVFMMATVSQLEPLCYIHSSWQMLSQTLQLWYNTLSGNYNICVERLVIIINTHMHIKQRLQVTTYTYIHSNIYTAFVNGHTDCKSKSNIFTHVMETYLTVCFHQDTLVAAPWSESFPWVQPDRKYHQLWRVWRRGNSEVTIMLIKHLPMTWYGSRILKVFL